MVRPAPLTPAPLPQAAWGRGDGRLPGPLTPSGPLSPNSFAVNDLGVKRDFNRERVGGEG